MEEQSLRFWFDTEEGEKEFELIGSFVLEGQDYAAFHPMDGEEGEVILLAVGLDEEEEPIFLPIKDDGEYEAAAEVFEALFNGEAEAEMFPEEDEEGRLFFLGENGEPVYLDENGEPME